MRHSVRALVIRDDQLLVMKRNKFGKQYFTLIGGGIDEGETHEQALHREVREETGLIVENPRHIMTMHTGEQYGVQYIFLCDYVSGEPKLEDDSEEAIENLAGENTFHPMWLPLNSLNDVEFLSHELKISILEWIKDGFPNTAEELRITI